MLNRLAMEVDIFVVYFNGWLAGWLIKAVMSSKVILQSRIKKRQLLRSNISDQIDVVVNYEINNAQYKILWVQ